MKLHFNLVGNVNRIVFGELNHNAASEMAIIRPAFLILTWSRWWTQRWKLKTCTVDDLISPSIHTTIAFITIHNPCIFTASLYHIFGSYHHHKNHKLHLLLVTWDKNVAMHHNLTEQLTKTKLTVREIRTRAVKCNCREKQAVQYQKIVFWSAIQEKDSFACQLLHLMWCITKVTLFNT